jgi:serine/threonine protein kinase
VLYYVQLHVSESMILLFLGLNPFLVNIPSFLLPPHSILHNSLLFLFMPSKDRSPSSDLSGNFIDDGRILLLKVIGSGGFGKVYKAIDTNSPPDEPQFLAVKCMLKPAPQSREAVFQANELLLHQAVSDNPHIVTFVKTVSDAFYVYFVLELAYGDLFYVLTKEGLFEAKDDSLVKKLFVQIIDAVDFCHNRGIYHRDLKPDNILMSNDGNVLLSDFGLSTSAFSSREFRCGSSNYMSPGEPL